MRLRYRYELNPHASTLVHVWGKLASRAEERTPMDYALYDVVDYGREPSRMVPEVIAYALRLSHAMDIAEALNIVESMSLGHRIERV